MYKAYKFRLYPNKKQIELLSKTFGCTRFVYNYFLDKCKKDKYISSFKMIKELKDLEKEYEWLKEVDSCSLRCSIFNLEDAYKRFFQRKSNYPNFKNRFNKQSYKTSCMRRIYKGKEYSNIELNLKEREIKLPKLGTIKIKGYRSLEKINGRIINVTITKEKTGKYLVEEIEIIKEKVNAKNIIGIDLGIKDLVVTSTGEKYSNPKEILRREKRLKRYQKKLSRQIKGSNNYNKTKMIIARIHNKIKNSRKHNTINIVNKLVRENDIIVSEKLRVKEMSKNHNLAKLILDASFNKICELLKWKTKEQGKYYYQIDSYYPSSKECNRCGDKTETTNNLGIRKWQFEKCGNENDRDINASINIMFEGLRMHY